MATRKLQRHKISNHAARAWHIPLELPFLKSQISSSCCTQGTPRVFASSSGSSSTCQLTLFSVRPTAKAALWGFPPLRSTSSCASANTPGPQALCPATHQCHHALAHLFHLQLKFLRVHPTAEGWAASLSSPREVWVGRDP